MITLVSLVNFSQSCLDMTTLNNFEAPAVFSCLLLSLCSSFVSLCLKQTAWSHTDQLTFSVKKIDDLLLLLYFCLSWFWFDSTLQLTYLIYCFFADILKKTSLNYFFFFVIKVPASSCVLHSIGLWYMKSWLLSLLLNKWASLIVTPFLYFSVMKRVLEFLQFSSRVSDSHRK